MNDGETYTGKQLLGYSLVIFVVFFLSIEGIARIAEIFMPSIPVDPELGFSAKSRLFVPSANPDVFVTNPDKTLFFNSQSFRMPKPEDVFRIFVFGGSSVNYLQPELQQLSARLRGYFDGRFKEVEIINAGGMSYGSHRLSILSKEAVVYDPDLVLIYSGHNEFEEIENIQLASTGTGFLVDLFSNLALFRFLRSRWVEWIIDNPPDDVGAWAHRFTMEDVNERMEDYEKNIDSIIRMHLDADTQVIIGTVPSNLLQPVLLGKSAAMLKTVVVMYEQGAYKIAFREAKRILRESPGRHQSSDLENEIIRSLSEEHGIPLADVEMEVIKAEPHGIPGETLFEDFCHLNARGNRIWIDTFEKTILEHVVPAI